MIKQSSIFTSTFRTYFKNTYGVIIYQEQIMQIASTFANFSYGEADILRRAMSKKIELFLKVSVNIL